MVLGILGGCLLPGAPISKLRGLVRLGPPAMLRWLGSMSLLAGLSALGALALPKMASKAYLIFLRLIFFTTPLNVEKLSSIFFYFRDNLLISLYTVLYGNELLNYS